MKPDIVVDVGNSRMKWGLCDRTSVRHIFALPSDDPSAWKRQFDRFKIDWPLPWAVAGVQPVRRDAFVNWLKEEDPENQVLVLKNDFLPIKVALEEPLKVGVDRLLNGIAARQRTKGGASNVIIDAGSAVTVDWVDAEGVFRGGAIFPGLRLMAKGLHDYTAQLPLVEVKSAQPPFPGIDTTMAIEAGIYWAVVGGIQALLHRMKDRGPAQIFLTGGDGALLAPAMDADVILWPEMTLEGIRIAAEAQP